MEMSLFIMVLKRLGFNKGWNVLGYLGVENSENDTWATCLGYFNLRVEASMGSDVLLPGREL